MTFPTAELERIIDNAFNAGEIESQITEEESKLAKQQILSEHIKAEKYDSLMKANSEIVQHNIDITKEHEIVERLKAELAQCELTDTSHLIGYEQIQHSMWEDKLKSILENKPQ